MNDLKTAIAENFSEEEYKSLKNEISENSKIIHSLFITNATVTASLIGFALSKESAPVFLSPFLILIPSMFYTASQVESTVRIGQYLRIFLEPKLDRKWENRLFELNKRDLRPKGRKYSIAITSIYLLLSIICLVFSYFYQ